MAVAGVVSGSDSPTAASGPRPATNPAAAMAATVGPGMNHVQSMADWIPYAIADSARAVKAVRSAVQSGPIRPLRSRTPSVRPVAASHAARSASETNNPARPRSAMVWGRKPCAWLAARGSSRYSSRASVKPSAPRPSRGRSLNTSAACRQYSPRAEDTEPNRSAPEAATVLSSAVSSSRRLPMPPPLAPTDTRPTTASTARPAPSAMPERRRVCSDGFMVARMCTAAKPATVSASSVPRTSRPNVPATSSRTCNGWSAAVKASCDNAQAVTGTTPTAATASTGAVRRRSGTHASQIRAARTAAARAPRDWVSMIVRSSTPRAGYASAAATRGASRRAPSQSAPGTASAAMPPRAFQ